jgi:outer membrane protein OmpA-like peptidoglycan-associated protein
VPVTPIVNEINVRVKDDNRRMPKEAVYSFSIAVLSDLECRELNGTNKFSWINQTMWVPRKFSKSAVPWTGKQLKAQIKSVSQNGIVTIGFNKAVIKPGNYSVFNNQTIDIQVYSIS